MLNYDERFPLEEDVRSFRIMSRTFVTSFSLNSPTFGVLFLRSGAAI
jgi:hypothetical protein